MNININGIKTPGGLRKLRIIVIFAADMANSIKTNAVRLLDKAGIAYKLVPYKVDDEHLDAIHVADSLGEDVARVFKTLVLRGARGGLTVCVIPGNAELDLKKVAKAAGEKKMEMIAVKELLPLTGYIRGGCSPIGMKKALPTYFHSSALDHDTIYVSAGVRGLQIEAAPGELIAYTRAAVCDLISENLLI